MSYRIDLASSAAHTFKKLDKSIQEHIRPKIDSLALNPRPHGAEKLAGRKNRYRLRAGDYRIIYAIEDHARLIEIAVIRHRRDVYR